MFQLITNRRRWFEIIAVITTALSKFFFMDFLNWRFPFVICAILFWAVYILLRHRKSKGILYYWGFRKDNFKRALNKVLPFGIIALVVFLGIGLYRETINVTWHFVPILLTYPIWGTIQQFLLIGLVGGNLHDLGEKKLNKHVVVLSTALVFAIVHYPYYWLMAGTFILALFYGYIYQRERNLYVLGLFHGILAALFYYTVLDQDPFLNTFGKLLNIS